MTQFLEAYKDGRKYMSICFSDSHEATKNIIRNDDRPLYKANIQIIKPLLFF